MGDEAASVLSATRPLPSLFAELSRVDAIHAVYYLFLHHWVAVFGASDFAVRFPSAIAAGFAAAGTVVVGRQLFSARIGILAGLVLTVMPQFTRMGMEGRSYALGIATAVWLTSHLITTIRRGGHQRRSWILYAIGVAAAIYLFLYLVLLLIVHLVMILSARLPVRTQLRWAKSVGAGLLLATPILLLGITRRRQIAFLAHRDYAPLHSVLVGQWLGSTAFAVLAWTLIVVGLLGAVQRRHRGPGMGALTVFAWLTIPTAVLLAGNAFITPMYSPRYLTFGAPAAAILIALGIHTISHRLVVLSIGWLSFHC